MVAKEPMAPESAKTRKQRARLQKKLERQQKKVTPEALKQKIVEMHKWIAKHAEHRVVLRAKSIALFDENRNAVAASQKVMKIMMHLREGMGKTQGSSLLKKMVHSQVTCTLGEK